MEMRRKDLAVTDPKALDEMIQRCSCFRLAFADGSHPYIVPLSFGYAHEGEERTFYFHSAGAGRKVDLCRKLGWAGFELDNGGRVKPNEKACDFSVAYESIIGEGEIQELTDLKDKAAALQVIMAHYSGRGDWEMLESVLKRTCVFRLTVKEISGRTHG